MSPYATNVTSINTVVTNVVNSSLPQISSPPFDWQSYGIALQQAQSDALDWVNKIVTRLQEVPGQVPGYNSDIIALLQDAQTQATTLVSDPSNPTALAALTSDLSNVLNNNLKLVSDFVSGTIDPLWDFDGQLVDAASQLLEISQMAWADRQDTDGLTVVAQTYSSLTTQALSALNDLIAVLQEWLILQANVNTVISDINTASSMTNIAQYQAVLNSVNAAIADWNAADLQAQALQLASQS